MMVILIPMLAVCMIALLGSFFWHIIFNKIKNRHIAALAGLSLPVLAIMTVLILNA